MTASGRSRPIPRAGRCLRTVAQDAGGNRGRRRSGARPAGKLSRRDASDGGPAGSGSNRVPHRIDCGPERTGPVTVDLVHVATSRQVPDRPGTAGRSSIVTAGRLALRRGAGKQALIVSSEAAPVLLDTHRRSRFSRSAAEQIPRHGTGRGGVAGCHRDSPRVGRRDAELPA